MTDAVEPGDGLPDRRRLPDDKTRVKSDEQPFMFQFAALPRLSS